MTAPQRRHRGPAPRCGKGELVVDHQRGRGSRGNPTRRQVLGIRRIAADPNLDFGAACRMAPRRQCGSPELGGHYALHALGGSRDELLDDVADRSRAFDDPGDGLDRFVQSSYRARQPLESFALLARQLNEEGLWIGCTIASRAPAAALRRATPRQSLECGIGIGPSISRSPRDDVASRRTELEQCAIDARFGRSESERGEVYLSSSNSYY